MTSISENFGDLSIVIGRDQIIQVERMAIHFVIRKTHPLTFNGMALGVHPIAFLTSDYNALFDVFNIRKQDVEAAIRKTSSIDRSFIVTSDPYNLLIFWLCHLAPIYIKDKNVCKEFMAHLLHLFMFKIMCSVTNNSFRHGANEGIMNATILGLSRKSDVVRLGSWAKVIDSHVEKILDPADRFYQTIIDGAPDEAFLRVVAESQTSIRAKIVTFAGSYYEAHAAGDTVGSRSSVAENTDGEKIIAQSASVIDSATQAMVAEILNANMFVHDISIDDVAGMFTTISPRMLKTALLLINEQAVLQTAARSFDKIKKDKEGILYIGVRVLIMEIIRSMVRMCREKRVNMGNRALVFETMRNAYSSSRSLDSDVIAIKRSVAHLTDPFNITVNPASQSALRLAVVYYILYRMITKLR